MDAEDTDWGESMIMLLDDHPIARQGLENILKLHRPDTEFIQVKTVQEALKIVKEKEVKIAFVDLYLSNESGFDFIEKVRESGIPVKLILLTSSSKKSDFLKARELEVDAFVLKDAMVEEILYGLRVVEGGGTFYSETMMESVHKATEEEKRMDTLTEREREILKLLGEGKKNASIGEELMISEGTVKKHISNILSKLNLKNRVSAVIFAGKYNGLNNIEK